MLYFTEYKSDCVGCGACMSACKTGCISMVADEEGFLYPTASDQCIRCGKCEQVCPIVHKNMPFEKQPLNQSAVCAITKDKKLWYKSASGGAFSEICNVFGNKETIVCGAAWDGFNVHHICVKGVQSIAPLRKSKYVASSLGNVFSRIKSYLNNNQTVIFCGTPCQIAGLKSFLGEPFENLLLIDLVCHGVGSPVVFKTCIDVLSRQFKTTVTSYEFRAKKSFKTDDSVLYIKNDPYIQLFLSQSILRPSCGKNCRFRSSRRQGDITIADFKGLTKVFPDLNCSNQNYSTIVASSEKGHRVLKMIESNMNIRECAIADIEKYNPLFSSHTWFSTEREKFFSEFSADPVKTVESWTKPAVLFRNKLSLKSKVWMLLPRLIRLIMIKVIKKLTGKTIIKESEYASCSVSKITINNSN